MANTRHRKQRSSLIRACQCPQRGAHSLQEEHDVYVRARHLPRLIALWPEDLADESEVGSERILERLRRALRAERRRGRSGHWSYDLNRHLGLIRAYKAELRHMQSLMPKPAGRAGRLQTGQAADRLVRRSKAAKRRPVRPAADWRAP